VRHHLLNREHQLPKSTHRTRPRISTTARGRRRGFSLIEVAIALAVFSLLAGVVTVAIARAQLGSLNTRFEREARGAMTSLVDQVATGSLTDLVDGSFLRPQACPQDAFSSCVTIQDRVLEIRWTTQVTNRGAVMSSVLVQANTELPDERVISAARTIVIPAGFSSTDAQLRVRTSGITYTGLLHLITAGGSSIASAPVSDGVALITAPERSCTTQKPCRVAMTPTGGWSVGATATSDAVTVDATTAIGPAGRVVLDSNTIVETSVVLRRGAVLDVKLYARNSDGRTAAAVDLGSVCLWATFNDGVANRSVPACNTELADRVSFVRYAPESSAPDKTLLIPTNTTVELRTDRASGGCPALSGMRGWSTPGWVETAVCTSHTWGKPSTLLQGSTSSPFEGSDVELDTARTTVRATWEGTGARPASGYTGEPLWGKPRNILSCATSKSCLPVTTAPELADCPDEHCRSDRNFKPRLVSPATGTLQVNTVSRTGTQPVTFTLAFSDADAVIGATSSVALVAAPSNGVLSIAGSSLVGPGPVTSFIGKTGAVTAVYTPTGVGSALDTFTLRLVDADGAWVTTTIGVAAGVAPWLIDAEGVSARQGSTANFPVTVYGTDGEVLSGVTLSVEAPTGLIGTQASPDVAVSTDASGRENPGLVLDTIRAGRYSVVISATSGSVTRRVSAPLYVIGAPASLELSVAAVGQEASSAATVSVRDRAGSALAGVLVDFAVQSGGVTSLLVTPKPGACVTNTEGFCSVLVTAAANATAGAYTLSASTGTSGNAVGLTLISASRTFNVNSVAQRLVITEATVTQGSSATLEVRLSDGAGTPVPGVQITATGPNGLTFNAATTDSKGVARLTMSASTSMTSGAKTVTVTAGTVDGQGVVRVVGRVVEIVAPSVSVDQGAAVGIEFKLFDVNGAKIANRALTFNGGDLVVSTQATSDANGVVRVVVTAPLTAGAGDRIVAVLEENLVVGGITVEVTTGVASATIYGQLTRGDTQTLRIQLRDANGNAVVGRSVTLVSSTSSMKFTGSAVTAVDGVADVPVRVDADALTGPVPVTFDTGSRTLRLLVVVK
jgi:prepilin-type N-terminal cleavage/methylation domain-containing protein